MITLGKQGTLSARRRAASLINSRAVVKKLFDEIAPRYAKRNGGYTRVVKLGVRLGDAAAISMVELVERAGAAPEPKKKPARRRDKADTKAKKAPEKKAAPRRKAAAG
jgi:large subunit ribosomal protein L17